MPGKEEIEQQISDAEKELTHLDAERTAVISRLQSLRQNFRKLAKPNQQLSLEFKSGSVTNQSQNKKR